MTRSMTKRCRIETFMPTKDALLAACAGVEQMLAYARSVPDDTSQDWHWGFGAPTNYFRAINYLSSNQAFIARNALRYVEQITSAAPQDATPEHFAYLNSVRCVLQMESALAALRREAPEWAYDPMYGSEFGSW